jgi:hypothetical protein
MPESWSAVIKAAGPASGAFALIAVALFGGQFAAKFKSPFDDFASWMCIIMLAIGAIIAIIQIGMNAYRSSGVSVATRFRSAGFNGK